MKTWRYSVPNTDHYEGWAIAFMDEAGCFAVLSDYGDYTYRWGSIGAPHRDIRSFVIGCDDSYLLGKLAPEEFFDGEKTTDAIRAHIDEQERDGAWSAERVAEERERIENGLDNERDFYVWHDSTDIDDAHSFWETSPNRHAIAFLHRAWPRLKAVIGADLELEARTNRETGSRVMPPGIDNPGPTASASSNGVDTHSQGASPEAANVAMPQSDPGKASASDTRLSFVEAGTNPLYPRVSAVANDARKRFGAELEAVVEQLSWFVAGAVGNAYAKGRIEERGDVLTHIHAGGLMAGEETRTGFGELAIELEAGDHVAAADTNPGPKVGDRVEVRLAADAKKLAPGEVTLVNDRSILVTLEAPRLFESIWIDLDKTEWRHAPAAKADGAS